MKTKLFTLLLAVAAGAGTLFASTKIGDLYYNLDATNKTAEVTFSSPYVNYGCLVSAVIPSTITYGNINFSVTSIGERAFSGCSGLTSIEIPNSVTSIGEGAFDYCTGLASVTIPNGVTSIREYTFYNCSSLTSVTIPNSVTSIGDFAFQNCTGLTSVTIGKSVTSIGLLAFRDCIGVLSVEWNAKDCNGWNFGGQVERFTFGNAVEVIPSDICSGMNKLAYIVIPNSVTSIGSGAFGYCTGLTSVTIPNSISSIGESAFQNCSGLTSVTIGNSVTSIGGSAFWGCTGLTSIEIPNSVTSIGYYAFSALKTVTINSNAIISKNYEYDSSFKRGISLLFGTQVTNYIIGDDVTSIGNYIFYRCSSLTSVTIPNGITSIGEGSFNGCSGLTSITIPNSVKSIGNNAFSGCSNITSVVWNAKNSNKAYFESQVESFTFGDEVEVIPSYICHGMNKLTEMIIPNSVTSIGESAFQNCSGLTSVTIGNSVTSIGEWAFDYCTSLTSVTIPNSVTSVEAYAFNYCTGLTSVTIGNSVTSIGDKAFFGCRGLTSITCEAVNPPILGSSVFYEVNKSIPLYVPAESLNAYKSADKWKDFYNILPIGSQGIEEIVENSSQDGKFIHDGKVFILRGEKVYTLQGQEVK